MVFRGGSQSDGQMAPESAHSAGEPLNLNHVEVSSQPLDYVQTFAQQSNYAHLPVADQIASSSDNA